MGENEKRILVVDDDASIRALLMTILRRRGLKVDAVPNGIEALDRCSKCHYSVALLDLMMPLMSGYEFLAEIAKMPKSQRPIIIVLTAGTPPPQLDPDVVAGSLKKPFDIGMLVDTVTSCMTTVDGQRQPPECPGADSERALN